MMKQQKPTRSSSMILTATIQPKEFEKHCGTRAALSNIHAQQNSNQDAVEYLEQILDEFPDDPGANNDLGYLWADQNKHLQRAERMTRLAVTAEPDNYAYRDSLGWALFRLNRYPEALEQLQKATSAEEPDGEVLAHTAEVHIKLGHPAEAKALLSRAAEAFKKAGEAEKMKMVERKLRQLTDESTAK